MNSQPTPKTTFLLSYHIQKRGCVTEIYQGDDNISRGIDYVTMKNKNYDGLINVIIKEGSHVIRMHSFNPKKRYIRINKKK